MCQLSRKYLWQGYMKRLCPETQRCGFEQEKNQSRYSSKVDSWQKSRGCWVERLNSYRAWLTVSKEESCLAKLLCRPCFAIILNPASDWASTHQQSRIKHQHRRNRRRGYLLSILGCRLERWLIDVPTDRWARIAQMSTTRRPAVNRCRSQTEIAVLQSVTECYSVADLRLRLLILRLRRCNVIARETHSRLLAVCSS